MNKLKTFTDKESQCRYLFQNAAKEVGPFWHICTPGTAQEIINITEDDYKFSVNNLAISALEENVIILTDAHMENHLHALMGGPKERCLAVLDRFRARLKRYLHNSGRFVDLRFFRCDDPIPVDTLEAVRNEIAYINRNGYVVNPDYLPFSYPWGGGFLYFNPPAQRLSGISYNTIPFRVRRKMCLSRVSELPENYLVLDKMIQPVCYVHFALGESMFRDAHHYLYQVTKNFEAYSEEAKRLGDRVIVSRDELFSIVQLLSKRDYNIAQPALLPTAAKLEIARTIHSQYNASNAQIRSLLKLPEQEVNALFPLKTLPR